MFSFKSSRVFRRLVTSFLTRRTWLRYNFVVALVLAATFAISAQSLSVHARFRSSVLKIDSLRSSCAVVRASWEGDGDGSWATAETRKSGTPSGILEEIGKIEARDFIVDICRRDGFRLHYEMRLRTIVNGIN
jgi:hypothetical protein